MRTIVKAPTFRNLLDANFYPSNFGSALEELYGQTKKAFVPAVNVRESENEYKLEFLVPGFIKENIQVNLDDKTLTVLGEHKSELEKGEANFVRKEFTHQSFKRVFTLPENIEKESLSAKYENGILHVILPKKSTAKVEAIKTIAVQ